MRPRFAYARATAVPRVRRVVGGVAGCSLAVGLALAPAAAASAAATPAPVAAGPAASSAAAWLSGQLSSGHGLMPGLSAAVPDVGLTSDTLLSLVAAGQRQQPGFAASLAAVASHLTGYASFPAGNRTALLAGPVAKTLFLAEVSGADPASFGGLDLPATLRSLMTTSGLDAGRFSDVGTGANTSNGFSQAFAILGLLRDPGGPPASAISFLLAQQCPSGAFRLFYDNPGGCRSDSQADPDATTVTIQALSALLAKNPALQTISTARTAAARYLASRLQPDGGIGGAGPTAGENANTTALASVAFRETGSTAAAEATQRYVAGLQLPSGPDSGAVAYNRAALAAIRQGAIPSADADQWRRSTSQAILAFGLPGYDTLATVSGAPLPPGTPTPTPPSSAPSTSPTPLPTRPRPVSQTANGFSPSGSASAAATDVAGLEQLAETNLSPDGGGAGSVVAGSDSSTDQPDNAAVSPSAPAIPAAQSTPATPSTTNVPLHATPQAAVTARSADGSVPGWVWILIAAAAGVGGGIVVLRLQGKRANS